MVGLALAALWHLDDSLAGVCSDFSSHDPGFHDRLGAGSLEGEFSAKVADCRCVSHRLKVELVEPRFLLCHLCGLRCGGVPSVPSVPRCCEGGLSVRLAPSRFSRWGTASVLSCCGGLWPVKRDLGIDEGGVGL